MFCEEIDHSLESVASHISSKHQEDVALSRDLLITAEIRVRTVQDHNTEAAAKQIKGLLPKDFRSTLLEMKQAAGERKNQRAVEDLIKKGCTIRERYELYLQQVATLPSC